MANLCWKKVRERPRLWRNAALVLLSAALPVQFSSARDLHPQYARVDGDIETVWQRPPREPKGIFFIAHGCNHQGTDIFREVGSDGWRFEACAGSNFGSCLGLPEEVRLQEYARSRGYLVMAVSGGTGRQSCWSLASDHTRVAAAIRHVRQAESLPDTLPVLAMGASSGGALMGRLAAPLAMGGLPGLRCIVPMIMGLRGAEHRGVPTLFVHMTRDYSMAEAIGEDIERLQRQGVRVGEVRVEPQPVTVELLSRCLEADAAKDVLVELMRASVLDAKGFLKEEARKRHWVEPARKAIAGRSTDTLVVGESCLAEEMNLAWAQHEFTADFAKQMIDFCEVPPAGAGSGDGGEACAPVAGPAVRGGKGLRGAVQQILVFDAGSSGTRVHVFNMDVPPPGAHVPLVDLAVREKQTLKIKPGLSQFAESNDLAGVDRSLRQLLDFADGLVPAARRPATPALLKATAGLRAVSEARAEAVLRQVRDTLGRSGYRFREPWADIIAGKEEAGLAWVAANYLQGTFNGTGDGAPLGIIEMGGGSTQVAFQVPESEPVAERDSFVFSTRLGRRYHLYAHSYLGYGQDYAQATLRELMQPFEVRDPCYPKGYRRKAHGAQLVTGSGDAAACTAGIKASLFQPPASAPGLYADERPLRGRFVATQNFYFVRENLGMPMTSGEPAMSEAARAACAREAEPSDDPGRPNSCFGLCYQVVVMRALKALDASGVQVCIANAINGADADWALGAALVHALTGGGAAAGAGAGTGAGWAASLAALLVAVFVLVGGARVGLWPCLLRPAKHARKVSPKATTFGLAE